MINYKSSMISSKKQEDMPTAYKTNYQPNSPSRLEINSPKYRAISKYDNRINDAKNNINDMISQYNSISSGNRDAINHIRNVNSEAHKVAKQSMVSPKAGSPKRDPSNYSPQQTYIQSINYQNDNNLPFNQNQNPNYFPTPMPNNSNPYQNQYQNMSLEQENIQLRKALNDQIRQNNILMKRVQFLQKENEELRQAIYNYSGGKINLKPTSVFNNNPEQFNSSIDMPKTAKFRTHVNSQNMNSPQNLGENYNRERQLFQNLYRDLQNLKDQNEKLRQNTISVLKNGN